MQLQHMSCPIKGNDSTLYNSTLSVSGHNIWKSYFKCFISNWMAQLLVFFCVFFLNYNLDSQRLNFDYHFFPTTFCVIFEKVTCASSAIKWVWTYLLHRDVEMVLVTGRRASSDSWRLRDNHRPCFQQPLEIMILKRLKWLLLLFPVYYCYYYSQRITRYWGQVKADINMKCFPLHF